MIKAISDWFDHRTGHRKLLSALLIEDIPGGAKWRYVWGSCLVTVFLLQLVTGLLLVTAYSPGASTAWASVYFIQYQMDFGWLIRGIHHFGSQAMVVLLALHVLQVVIAGAHLPPREINWWLGLALLGAVLGLSLTGYLLPWDQKGYWATQVATNIAGNLPVVGPWLQKIIVGGPNYGHHTLARFYTLHVALLPPLVLLLIGAHVAVFRRHGVTPPKKAEGQGWFWPDQAFRDMLIGLAVFAVILGVATYKHGHAVEGPAYGGAYSSADESLWQSIAHAGRDGRGANLDAPADPGQAYPARPEWYFLSLFQLLKYFEGPNEIIGTVIIPAGVGAALAILPLLGYGRMRKFGHVVGVLTVAVLLVGALILTVLGLGEDQPDPHWIYATGRGVAIVAVLALVALALLRRTDQTVRVLGITAAVAGVALALNAYLIQDQHEPSQRARAVLHQDQLASAQVSAQRAIALADLGIPPSGPVQLLRRDPMTRGQALFGQHCASCHNYGVLFTDGNQAADLENLGTEAWILGLLQNPGDPKYFGNTELTKMADWAEENLTELSDEEQADLRRIAKWLAGHPTDASPDAPTEAFQKGLTAFQEAFGRRGCVDCHGYEGEGGKQRGPDFTGYMSADWIRAMVMSADHKLRYGTKNAMPIFLDLDGPAGTSFRLDNHDREPSVQHLGTVDRELIIRWLVKDYRPVFGGDPISAPPAP